MPLYQYDCLNCGRVTEGMRLIEERRITPECYFCGAPTEMVIPPVRGIVKNPAVPKGNFR